jgi:predicted small secreted protein
MQYALSQFFLAGDCNVLRRSIKSLEERMKRILIIYAVMMCVLLVAGCTTVSPGGKTEQSVKPIPSAIAGVVSGTVLPMNAEVMLGTTEKPFNASIYSIEIDPPDDAGKHTINIYIGAKNTGTIPRNLTWYSKLTDINGKTYGGIGVSHGGSGARTWYIPSNLTEAARDYIVINNDQDFATLSKGAILDVYFLEFRLPGSPLVPDYHVTWGINPGIIQ